MFTGYCYECDDTHMHVESDRGGTALCGCCGFMIRGILGIEVSKELTKMMDVGERKKNWEKYLRNMEILRRKERGREGKVPGAEGR